MSDIALVGNNRFDGRDRDDRSHRMAGRCNGRSEASDAEVSRWRRQLDRLGSDGEPCQAGGDAAQVIRWDRIRRVRDEIDAGTYLTDERIDAAVTGMLQVLDT